MNSNGAKHRNRRLPEQLELYEGSGVKLERSALPRLPSTRYQGSKRKIAVELANAFRSLSFSSALDLYSGTATISLILRYLGKHVDSNDYLKYNQTTARLFLRLRDEHFTKVDHGEALRNLLSGYELSSERLVSENFAGIFFTDQENEQIDRFCQNIGRHSGIEKDLYVHALGQALLKKRPYNLFHRANLNMRQRRVKRSFGNAATWEVPIYHHAMKCIQELKRFPFDALDDTGSAFSHNTKDLQSFRDSYDLIYLDPPYLNSQSVGVNYSDFYGFLEGLCDYTLFAKGDNRLAHKPFARLESNWNNPITALQELENVCQKWTNSILFLSYRSDGLPTPVQTMEALRYGGRKVAIHSCGEYKYVLSRTRSNEELFLISTP